MRSLINWKDMVCEFPNRFAQTVEGDKVTWNSKNTGNSAECNKFQYYGFGSTGSYADVFRSNENVAETE